MWGEFNVGDSYPKPRQPTIVRIEVTLINRSITAVWESLQIAKQMPFALEQLSGNDDLDVFSAAETAIETLEQADPPLRFVDGDTVEVWQILNDGELRLFAMATVRVTSLMCSECANRGSLPN